jgi:hypothetical protein
LDKAQVEVRRAWTILHNLANSINIKRDDENDVTEEDSSSDDEDSKQLLKSFALFDRGTPDTAVGKATAFVKAARSFYGHEVDDLLMQTIDDDDDDEVSFCFAAFKWLIVLPKVPHLLLHFLLYWL